MTLRWTVYAKLLNFKMEEKGDSRLGVECICLRILCKTFVLEIQTCMFGQDPLEELLNLNEIIFLELLNPLFISIS